MMIGQLHQPIEYNINIGINADVDVNVSELAMN